MKKITALFALFISVALFTSCEGPEGARGPQGAPGTNIESEVFEVTSSFSATNDFSISVPLNPNILASDNVLVYELVGVFGGKDIWSPLPTQYYLNGGDLRYFFDFTRADIKIYLDSSIPVSDIPDQYRINKTFRIVIIPGYFSMDNLSTDKLDVLLQELSVSPGAIQQLN